MFKTVEEHNKYINDKGLVGYDGGFEITFRDRKKVLFWVTYGTHGQLTQNPYLSTSAGEFNHRRTDWDSVGQGQEELLKNKLLIYFFNKWDKYHLKPLTFNQYDDLLDDIEYLKDNIPYTNSTSFNTLAKFDRNMS